jgi:hypothetical protein
MPLRLYIEHGLHGPLCIRRNGIGSRRKCH